MTFEITHVENGATPNEEKVWLKATAPFNTKGFAIVDRTFDESGELSNEFRHIYVFPEIALEKDQIVILRTGKGKNGIAKFTDTDEEYHRLYWGSESCVWNDNGGDTATLISFIKVNSKPVPSVKKK